MGGCRLVQGGEAVVGCLKIFRLYVVGCQRVDPFLKERLLMWNSFLVRLMNHVSCRIENGVCWPLQGRRNDISKD